MNFTHIDPDEVRIRNWIGTGRTKQIDHDEHDLRFTIRQCHDVDLSAFPLFSSAKGAIIISQPDRFFQLISDIPLFPEAFKEADPWFFELINTRMISGFRSLFVSFLSFLDDDHSSTSLIPVEFILEKNHVASSFIAGVPFSLMSGWMSTEGFNPKPSEWWSGLPLILPVQVGRVRLSLGRVNGITQGDVLLLSEPMMNVDGEGIFECGKVQFFFELEPESENSHQYHMAIKSKQGQQTMTQHDNEDIPLETEEEQNEGELIETPIECEFNDLPLDLTIRCGHLSMTLGELKNLDTGSTLVVDHVTPGEALLCHGNYLLAKGELVNVNGTLGLQIKSLFRHAPV